MVDDGTRDCLAPRRCAMEEEKPPPCGGTGTPTASCCAAPPKPQGRGRVRHFPANQRRRRTDFKRGFHSEAECDLLASERTRSDTQHAAFYASLIWALGCLREKKKHNRFNTRRCISQRTHTPARAAAAGGVSSQESR